MMEAKRRRGEHAGVDWDTVPLGKMSDSEIAKMTGVSRQNVEARRHARGIAAFKPALADRCEECGAEPGERCTTARSYPHIASGRSPGGRRHHLRGRARHCGRRACATCTEFFGEIE